MPPFTIKTTGHATISHPAERGILRINIHDSGPAPSAVSSTVLACTNHIKSLIIPLNTRSASGEVTSTAAITHWSMGSLSTYSHAVYDRRTDTETGHSYHARAEFEIKFRNFATLASVATELSGMPLVNIDGVEWKLTDVSKRELARRVRSLAGKDALERAEDYASTFGKQRVAVVEVLEEGGWRDGAGFGVHSARRAVARRDSADGGEGLSFQPEEVEVSAEVSVKFVTE
ncbi:hypothetical protein BJX63DRAFT_411086 [Aspergillus granulosus]|uniref:DUF541 domain-containing protein n=1 Tax=Aspergillus granulosus TaxID=176169 RepID=A0ABR4GX62_9EURO